MTEKKYYLKSGYTVFDILKPAIKGILRINVTGQDNIPLGEGCILASNHKSHLDPLVLNTASTRPVLFLAKQELFKPPIFGWFVKNAGAIPVNRDGRDIKSLKAAFQALKDKQCIGIFPEGRRMPPDKFGKPQSGVGLLASRTGVPVVPVLIMGTEKVLPKGSKFPKLFKYDINIMFGKPLVFSKEDDYREVSEIIMEKIKTLKEVNHG